MDEVIRKQLAELKADPYPGHLVAIGDTQEMARVKFIGRGELAFYQEGERALLAEVLVGPAVIDASSISRWDTGEKVGEAEREAIIDRIATVLLRMGATQVRVPPRAADLKLIKKLKKEAAAEYRVASEDVEVRLEVRAGQVLYRQGERALLLTAGVTPPVIRVASIQRWDDGLKVGEDERAAIVEHVTAALRQAGADRVELA